MSWLLPVRRANYASKPVEAQVIEGALVWRFGFQALADQLASTEQHQAVDKLRLALAGSGEVAADQGVYPGIVKVPGYIGRSTGCDGDQRIER
ncbi:hypothetical protein, partial [Pseudomonas sp.]|uniref:hypothetical protein n=1 Tax=Pseudomonas sp. TaxID=306 RepID=UPI0027330A8A